MSSLFLLLQLSDPQFPIGSYAHSYGLETYIQKGLIRTADDADRYLRSRLREGVLYGDLLPVRLAWEAAAAGDLPALHALDECIAASRAPEELRSAGWKMGSRFLKTVRGMTSLPPAQVFSDYAGAQTDPALPRANYSVCFGAFCAACGILEQDTLSHFLYAQAAGMVTCCVKAIPLSQTAGQRLLCGLHTLLDTLTARCLTLDPALACLSAPGFDLRCMQHERLYSRLYMS